MSYKYCPHCGGPLPAPIEAGHHENTTPGYFNRPRAPEANWAPVVPVGTEQKKPSEPVEYDQDASWRRVMGASTSRPGPLSIADGKGGKSVIHFVFKERVCPAGGLMHELVRSVSVTQPRTAPALTPEELTTLGYAIDDEKHLLLANDLPVGPVYGVLQYWGGEKQHKRWHLSQPIGIDANRKGNPCFMDENLVAIVAHWDKAPKIMNAVDAAVGALLDLLRNGIRGEKPIGEPILIDLEWIK